MLSVNPTQMIFDTRESLVKFAKENLEGKSTGGHLSFDNDFPGKNGNNFQMKCSGCALKVQGKKGKGKWRIVNELGDHGTESSDGQFIPCCSLSGRNMT